jgi:hypothetical protein
MESPARLPPINRLILMCVPFAFAEAALFISHNFSYIRPKHSHPYLGPAFAIMFVSPLSPLLFLLLVPVGGALLANCSGKLP